MKRPHFTRRFTHKTYRVFRVLVGIISTLVLLIIFLCVFLRVKGVPEPLVHKIVHRINQAGLPVNIEGIFLTLNGWRLDQFVYYSDNPDDLKPILEVRHIYLNVRHISANETAEPGWGVTVRAQHVDLSPPKDWRIDINDNSPFRHVDQIEVDVNLQKEKTILSGGNAKWLGVDFTVNGTFIHKPREAVAGDREIPSDIEEKTSTAPFFSGEQFQRWENVIDTLSVNQGARADIRFTINSDDFSATQLDLNVKAEEIAYQGLDFTKGEVLLSYAYPVLKLDRARMFKGSKSIQVSSEYNVDSKALKSTLSNSITDKQLLVFLSPKMRDSVAKFGLNLEQLPSFKVNLGPTNGIGLFNHISGEFSIRDISYKNITASELRGKITRENQRIEFNDVKGVFKDQPTSESSSSMRGGPASGRVFWDGKSRAFGLKADIEFDPNLLTESLSRVRIATNVIERFSFKDAPPHVHLDLGAHVDNWKTFYIDARVLANDLAYEEVDLSSLNVTTSYTNLILNLSSLAAMQGVDYTRGSVKVDFREDFVQFDVKSSMSFAELETAIYPKSDLFEKMILSAGDEQLAANGIIEWGGKGKTDFKASVKTDHLNFSGAKLDHFVTDLSGKDHIFLLQNLEFSLYGGPAKGEFSIELDSKTETTPYRVDIEYSNVDFDQLIGNFNSNITVRTKGEITGKINCTADLSTNFMAAAKGSGELGIENGQLSDLPLFRGFSRLVRKIFPSFKVFSITSLTADYTINDGALASDKVYFGGTLISASARGEYSADTGFDAYIYAQILNESRISKVVRLVTDPLMKFLQFKLEGPMSDPSWSLQKSPRNLFQRRNKSKNE
jgi:hypothetical protein